MDAPAGAARPRVSVAMVVLRPHGTHFPEAVASVLGQTVADLELVIVEDPSEVSAAEVLGTLVDDPRVRLVTNPGRTSLVDQRNRALELSRADVVAVLDADDVAEPRWLEAQLRRLGSEAELDVVGSQLTVIDEHGRVVGRRRYPERHEEIVAAMPRHNPIAQPGVTFRRRVVVDAGGYAGRRANEDYELWSRLAAAGRRFANQPDALIRYRVHRGSMKARALRETLRGTLAVKWRYWRGRLGVAGWVQFVVEALLLLLPPRWVYAAFVRLRYERVARP